MIAFFGPLAEALAILGVPQGIVISVAGVTNEPWLLILLMIVILIAAGCDMGSDVEYRDPCPNPQAIGR